MDFKISSFMVSHGFGSCLIACLCFSEWLTSHNSGDIVILNREQVGNPQIRHNDCQITIPKFHQKANGILCKVQSILFSQVDLVNHCNFVEYDPIFSWRALQLLSCGIFSVRFRYHPPCRFCLPKNLRKLAVLVLPFMEIPQY